MLAAVVAAIPGCWNRSSGSHGGDNYGCQCLLAGTVFGRKAVAVMTSSHQGLPVIWSLLAAVRDSTSWSDLPSGEDAWR
jgi:hypothetical protein